LCDLIGLEVAEIVGKNDLDLFLNPEHIMFAYAKVFETGQKCHIPIEPFTDKYGALYWFQTKKIPLKDNQGKVIQLLMILREKWSKYCRRVSSGARLFFRIIIRV
jgi:PAS domain-containing protein